MSKAHSIDQSVSASKSSIGISSLTKQVLIHGKTSPIDLFFPLFDNLSMINFPKTLCTLFSIFFHIQQIITCLWPYSYFYENPIPSAAKTHSMIFIVFWFNDCSNLMPKAPPIYWVALALSILSLLWLVSEWLYFQNHHCHLKWKLYVTKFIFDCITPIMIMPTAALTSATIFLLYETKDTSYVALFLSLILMDVWFLFLFFLATLEGKSAILSKTTFQTFDQGIVWRWALFDAIFINLAAAITVFPQWISTLSQLCHAVLLSYGFYLGTYLPFHFLWANVLYCSSLTSSIFLDVTMSLLGYFPNWFNFIPIIFGVGTFVISAPICYFSFKRKINQIKSQLSQPKQSDNPISEEVFTYLHSLNLFSNDHVSMMYIHISLSEASDYFLDGSLYNFFVKQIPSTQILSSLMQALVFFPSEIRKLNIIFHTMTSKRDLSFTDRFLVYQVYRIKTMRQSSETKDSLDVLNDLKTIRTKCETDTHSFWMMTDPEIAYCEFINSELSKNTAIFSEAIKNHPNNSSIAQEYSLFLSECASDYQGAVYYYQRAELSEAGNNFNIDHSFRSFVRRWPSYLKDEILDITGKRIIRNPGKQGSTSSSRDVSSGLLNSTDTLTIDAELEETIALKIFKQAKMRLALQHAIEDRKTEVWRSFMIAGIFIFIISLVVFVGIYIYMKISFSDRNQWILRLNKIMLIKFYLDEAVYNTLVRWLKVTGRFNESNQNDFQVASKVDEMSFIDYWSPLDVQCIERVNLSRFYLSSLLDELSQLSANGMNVYEVSSWLLSLESTTSYCREVKELGNTSSSLKNKATYMYFLLDVIAGMSDISDMFITNQHCEIILNFFSFAEGGLHIFGSFGESQIKEGKSLDSVLNLIEWTAPVTIFVFAFIPIVTILIQFMFEIKKALKMLVSLPQEAKDEAMKSTRIDNEHEDEFTAPNTAKFSLAYVVMVLYLILIIAMILLSYFFVLSLKSTNSDIMQLNDWFSLAAGRIMTSGQALVELFEIIVLNTSLESKINYTSRNHFITSINSDLTIMENSNHELLQDTETSKQCYGFDAKLDEIHFSEACKLQSDPQNMHDVYKCASLNQQIAIFRDMAMEVVANPDHFNGSTHDELTSNLMHILTSHLWNSLFSANNRMIDVTSLTNDTMLSNSLLYVLFGILIGFVSLLYTIVNLENFNSTYNVLMILIKHLPPSHIIASRELLSYLLNRSSEKDDKTMGISQSIVHNSAEAIVFTSSSLVVDIVNPTVSTLLGYTPNQMLGQDIRNFMPVEDSERFEKQIAMMLAGQCPSIYDDHINLLSDAALEIPFAMTIIGMKTEGSVEITSFVFILRDETEVNKQKREAELAKARSEKLLFQILPKDIVVRLNRGEKDISFSIAHATIFFIDIVKFSDYAAGLTPNEIMGNLSTVFQSFDQMVAKYPTITKIKLIGDVYMAAAGLFSDPDASPTIHAEESIKCTLECLKCIDEINIKLNASLEVRIGVNTGGPLISGVLGTDKPVFDIIGDPINIAARLQSTDIPGFVQISTSTKEYVENSGFSIEERGEVFLKGKGKQMTYFVHPPSAIIRLTSSGSFI